MNVDRMRRQLRRVGVLPSEPERFIPGFQEAIVAMEQRYQEELKIQELVRRFKAVIPVHVPDEVDRSIQAFHTEAARVEREARLQRRWDEVLAPPRKRSWLPW